MLKLFDSLPLSALLVLAILMGLAPMEPEPHLVEKLRMLGQGVLTKPIDIFDLLMHASGILLLVAKLARMIWLAQQKKNTDNE